MTRALGLATLLALAACEPATGAALAGASLVTLVHTDKTWLDHAASYATGENCTILHAARNEPYCQSQPGGPWDDLARLAATHHCYRTLGGVSCYDQPDYLASGLTRVDFAHGVTVPADESPITALPAPADTHRARVGVLDGTAELGKTRKQGTHRHPETRSLHGRALPPGSTPSTGLPDLLRPH